MMLAVLAFVFVVDQIYMAYFVQNSKVPRAVFNKTLNRTVVVISVTASCVQPNTNLVLSQDIMFVIMRIILPFIIMVGCNVILIRHIRESRNRVIRDRKEKKEHSFTKAVAIMNGSFLACNIGVVVYYIIYYSLRFSGAQWPFLSVVIFSLYGTCAILLSYMFTLSQFIIDMIFNKVFRKEILHVVFFLTRQRNDVEPSRTNNSNAN